MPSKRYKESDGIVQWVNTSKTGRPRFKLQEQPLATEDETHEIPDQAVQASAPVIQEPGGENPYDDGQHCGAEMQSLDLNDFELPIKKRKVGD